MALVKQQHVMHVFADYITSAVAVFRFNKKKYLLASKLTIDGF